MHGSLFHIASNMWFLHIFGDNVEDKIGHFRYLLFFLIAGIAAVSAQYFFAVNSTIPMIGASGAVSGRGRNCRPGFFRLLVCYPDSLWSRKFSYSRKREWRSSLFCSHWRIYFWIFVCRNFSKT